MPGWIPGTTAVWLCSAALLLAGCAGSASSGAEDEGDAALQHVLSGYVVDFLRRNPATSTYLGGGGLDPSLRDVDGMLRDHSPEALEDEDAWLRATERALEAVDVSTLSDDSTVDRELALAQIRFLLRQHGVQRHQERALDTYVREPVRAIEWQLQQLTQTGEGTYGTTEEWDLVIRRVSAVPAFLATAQRQLEAGIAARRIPDWRMAQRDGLEASDAHTRYLAATLPALAEARVGGPDRDRLLEALDVAARQASAAYTRFREFVAAAYFDGAVPKYAADRFALGEEEYDWALVNNFGLDVHAASIYTQSLATIEETGRQLVSLARTIGAARGLRLGETERAAVRAVLDELARDSPSSDAELVSWYRDVGTRLVAYGRRTGMFEIPADYELQVAVTSPPFQPSIEDAAYVPARPFASGKVGQFYVPRTGDDRAALLRSSRAAIAARVAREGFPGHGWYFTVLADAHDISPVRWLAVGALEDSSSMWQGSMAAAGWGLYAAATMAERRPDAPDGVYTPEERFYLLQRQLYRQLLVRIDTGIHLGRLTYDEAVTRLSEGADFLPGSCTPYIATPFGPAAGGGRDEKRASCDAAERAVFRSSTWPTRAMTHWTGAEQILMLQANALQAQRLSLPEFHRLVIRQGPIPPGFFRDTLLKRLDDGQSAVDR